MKTANLTGAALDWAVAKCEGVLKGYCYGESEWIEDCPLGYYPSTNWSQGGPIIESEIDVLRKRSKAEEESLAYPNPNFRFKAEIFADHKGYFCGFGPTPLIAAMRCYVASKLGDEVEIPECLTKSI